MLKILLSILNKKEAVLKVKNTETIFIHLMEFHLYKTVIHKEKVKIHLKNQVVDFF